MARSGDAVAQVAALVTRTLLHGILLPE